MIIMSADFPNLRRLYSCRVILIGVLCLVFNLPAHSADRLIKINDGWKFSFDSDSTSLLPGFDDSGWRTLNLPHDWSIEGDFDKEAASGNDGGYLPTGKGWYRKNIYLNGEDAEKIIKLYFEGVYMNSEVYVNGEYAGGHPYGYTSFYVDITPFVKPGKNLVAVKVDNSLQKNCRWYSGSGIYRNVYIDKRNKIGIPERGIHVMTPDLNTARIGVKIRNDESVARDVTVSVSVGNGVKQEKILNVPAETELESWFELNLPDAKSWTPDTPELYSVKAELKIGDEVVDRLSERFGFRIIEWSAENGLKLNGQPIMLNGGCVHHDNGILGAAAYDRAERKRVEQLKEAGFNAVRTSHNPPSEAFLDACDEVGLLVIDEAFDGWRDAKNGYDYHLLFDKDWMEDLDAMILRDRNHPSIFCWSTGNEVIERDKIEVVTTARRLAERCRQLDPTRPVTSALACWGKVWETYDPLAAQHDIVGYNYMIQESESDHARVPSRVMFQTESYPRDAWKNYRKVKDHPYIIGDFVWTAIDYIGESGIGRWYYEGDVPGEHYERPLFPWHAAYCGDIDLTGLRKPISHYRSILWNPEGEKIFMAVKEPDGYNGKIKTTLWGTWPTFVSWNWPGHEGEEIEVEVYTRYPHVRLSLNGSVVEEKNTEEMKALFRLPYSPGELVATGLTDEGDGESVAITTSGPPVALRLICDSQSLPADSGELAFIVIEAVDASGNRSDLAENAIQVSVTGNASLQALGNADIKAEDAYHDNRHSLWKGRALAVVRSNGMPGTAEVRVKSPDLKERKLKIKFVNVDK